MSHSAEPQPGAQIRGERQASAVLRVARALGIAALVVASLGVVVGFLLMPVAPV